MSLRAGTEASKRVSLVREPQAQLSFEFDASGPWGDHTETRCGAPQPIVFALEGEGGLSVEWDVEFALIYGGLGLFGESDDPKLEIRIERTAHNP